MGRVRSLQTVSMLVTGRDRIIWALTLPVSTSFHCTTQWSYDWAKQYLNALRPGLTAHIPCTLVCQLLVPARGHVKARRPRVHEVCIAHAVARVGQTHAREAKARHSGDHAGAARLRGDSSGKVDLRASQTKTTHKRHLMLGSTHLLFSSHLRYHGFRLRYRIRPSPRSILLGYYIIRYLCIYQMVTG